MINKEKRVQAHIFVDSGDASAKARKLLDDAGINFGGWEITGESDDVLPALFAGEGDFVGLPEIERFIEIVTQRPTVS